MLCRYKSDNVSTTTSTLWIAGLCENTSGHYQAAVCTFDEEFYNWSPCWVMQLDKIGPFDGAMLTLEYVFEALQKRYLKFADKNFGKPITNTTTTEKASGKRKVSRDKASASVAPAATGKSGRGKGKGKVYVYAWYC